MSKAFQCDRCQVFFSVTVTEPARIEFKAHMAIDAEYCRACFDEIKRFAGQAPSKAVERP